MNLIEEVMLPRVVLIEEIRPSSGSVQRIEDVRLPSVVLMEDTIGASKELAKAKVLNDIRTNMVIIIFFICNTPLF